MTLNNNQLQEELYDIIKGLELVLEENKTITPYILLFLKNNATHIISKEYAPQTIHQLYFEQNHKQEAINILKSLRTTINIEENITLFAVALISEAYLRKEINSTQKEEVIIVQYISEEKENKLLQIYNNNNNKLILNEKLSPTTFESTLTEIFS